MKRILALCMALIFIISIIAGCSSKEDRQDVNTAPKTVVSINEFSNTDANTADNIKANSSKIKISEDKGYTDKDHVAAYINEYAKLPHNYITKNQAKKLGWQTKGTLDKVAPGKSIGGDRYGNYEGKLPKKSGRNWIECDIDYVKGNRNSKRIVFSNDGLIYYTADHYNSFTKLYGK